MTTQIQAPWYDSRERMETLVKMLEGFHEVLKARHNAGYKHKETMNSWVIHGTWYLDSCGNCGKAHKPLSKDFAFPVVMTVSEFQKLAKDEYCSFSLTEEPPPTDVVCPHCGKGWSIENCEDNFRLTDTEVIPFEDYVGQALKEVIGLPKFKKRSDAHVKFCDDRGIRNDKYIDLSPHPEFSSLKVNEHGWLESDKEHIIEEGDEGLFWIFKWVHQDCRNRDIAEREHTAFKEAFKEAGFEQVVLEETPNEYCPHEKCSICGPWFIARTALGMFKIGWRKRVIHLELLHNIEIAFGKLFKGEDVTKGLTYIHCWGYEKLTEYLTLLHKELKDA